VCVRGGRDVCALEFINIRMCQCVYERARNVYAR
jgi:hypothetical protein